MTAKADAVKLGKLIRAQTGLKLPVAQRAARKLVRGKAAELLNNPLFPVQSIRRCHCAECSCRDLHYLCGPRGRWLIIGDENLW